MVLIDAIDEINKPDRPLFQPPSLLAPSTPRPLRDAADLVSADRNRPVVLHEPEGSAPLRFLSYLLLKNPRRCLPTFYQPPVIASDARHLSPRSSAALKPLTAEVETPRVPPSHPVRPLLR